MREKCDLLSEHPQAGEQRPEFLTGQIRSSMVGSYVIFYRAVADGIEIARVIRGDRDWRNL